MPDPARGAASPVSTGGVGTVVEHRYGGLLLAAMLAGEPVVGLGGALVPVEVKFQARSPVDDYVVTAEGGGTVVRWHVACRLRPRIGASYGDTVALVADYLGVLTAEAGGEQAGTTRLGLVTVTGHGPADLLATLAAAAVTEERAFRDAIAARSAPLSDLLARLDEVVAAAMTRLAWAQEQRLARDWTWTLLRALHVVPTDLGEGGRDAVAVTRQLASLLRGDVERADQLRIDLAACAADRAGSGATVTPDLLRRELLGRWELGPAAGLADAWETLAEDERALRALTPAALPDGHHVARAQELTALLDALRAASTGAAGLVVRGDPSVGKSVLTLAAVDVLRANGAAVAVVDLRGPDRTLPVARLLAGLPVGPVRLVVLDGAEAVQEDGPHRLATWVSAAAAARVGVVAVTRDDAAEAVRTVLTAGTGAAAAEHVVAPLSEQEAGALTNRFPALARLRDRRSQWLLRRLGLVSLLLHAGAGPTAPLRDGALSEADIFDICWQGWVRRPDRGRSPDARERALLEVANALLHRRPAQPQDVAALPALRSDGLLAPSTAFAVGERFTGDVARDLATVRLLLDAPAGRLAAAGAPRWALRAARVACQARLLHDGAGALPDLLEAFAALGDQYGVRWADVPWEAVLRLGQAGALLDHATPLLLADGGRALDHLLRAADQHVAPLDDPLLLEPLVGWLTAQRRPLHAPVQTRADTLVCDWLRAVFRAGSADAPTRALRVQVREAVLARGPADYDGVLWTTLALLVDELDDRAEAALRDLARTAPAFLGPVFEERDAPYALADRDSDLLHALAAAYYIETPRRDAWGGPLSEGGVRGHLGPGGGGWRLGAFWPLLTVDVTAGRDLVLAVVGHAARVAAEGESVVLDLLGLGKRTYLGTEETYRWYRGMTFAPAACTAALAALERAMDQLAERAGWTPRQVGRWALGPARDLAVVGLVVGFLVRHLDAVTDELDDVLAAPALWSLEQVRVSAECDREGEGTEYGALRRRYTLTETAQTLMSRARADGSRRDRLAQVGRRLQEAATDAARQNATLLDPQNYSYHAHMAHYVAPRDLRARAGMSLRDRVRVELAATLTRRPQATVTAPYYVPQPYPSSFVLTSDIATARTLSLRALEPADHDVRAATALVAAHVVGAVAAGREAAEGDLRWALSRLVDAAMAPTARRHADERSSDADGEDRIAAATLPSLLLPPFDVLLDDDDKTTLGRAVAALTTALPHQVRRTVAVSLRPVWAAPCRLESCPHRLAWDGVLAGVCDVAYTTVDPVRHVREFAALRGDLVAALAATPAEQLVPERLAAALVAVCHAEVASCVAPAAGPLRQALVEAYLRAAAHHTYRQPRGQDALVGRALLEVAARDDAALDQLVALARERARAVVDLLGGAVTAATYDPQVRANLRAMWPPLLAALLDGWPVRSRDAARTLAGMLPAPQPAMHDPDKDTVGAAAADGWPGPDALSELIDRWVPLAAGHRECVDQLVRLLEGWPRETQVRLGLPWVRRLVEPPDRPPVQGSFLGPRWLRALRDSGSLPPDAQRDFDVILDRFAAAGQHAARELQGRDD